jgi:2-oxoglutarate ferredoxin oxidoreductase subunit alpha
MSKRHFTLGIGGPAGYGINASGELLARAFTRGGWHVFAYKEYPSLIRGGHNVYFVHLSESDLTAHEDVVDLLICLDENTYLEHKEALTEGAAVIYDPDVWTLEDDAVLAYPVPMKKIVREKKGKQVMRNIVALGAAMALIDYPLDYLESLIRAQFGHKGEEIVQQNMELIKLGFDHAKGEQDPFDIADPKGDPKILLTGNEAISYGAIQAGCKFYSAYPMTPASSILSILAKHEEEMSMVVKQTEDELAAVLYAIGAGYAGVRSMAGTSGGGFALMNEGMSFAGIAEVPLVLVEAQRPGPATGLPTWTGQGDLQFVIESGQDEFPHAVLAPGDAEEAFYWIQKAFDYAERYHMPVVLLSDKYISESIYAVDDLKERVTIDRGPLADEKELANRNYEEDYPRYKDTPSGVSPRPLPGMPNARYIADSYEHDDFGHYDETSENRIVQHEKRMRKLETLRKELPEPERFGPAEAQVTIIGWGSTKGTALEAMSLLEAEGITVNYIHPIVLHPFPAEAMQKYISESTTTLLVEGNYRGQLGELLRQHCLLNTDHQLLKYDGRPIFPSEIVSKIKSILS